MRQESGNGTKNGALAALGLAAGFSSSFLGIGGGLVIVPILMIAWHYPLKKAVGTSLATIVLVSLVGVVTEALVKWSNIHWGLALILTAGSLAGSWAGARALPHLPETPLRIAYCAFLALSAYRMFASARAGEGAGAFELASAPLAGAAVALAAGSVAGVSSVLFGIGGGVVIVPALSLLFRDIPFHAARATSLVTIVPVSLFGALQHRRLGNIEEVAVRWLVPTGLLGAIAGVLVVNRLPARPCRIAFGVFLVAAAVRLLTLRAKPPASKEAAL
jgi:uncharacterized membrane protein YfcA